MTKSPVQHEGLFWTDLPKLPPKRSPAERQRITRVGVGPVPIGTWGGPPAEFPRIPENEIIGLDLETRDPDLLKRGPGWAYTNAGEVVGISLAWGTFEKAYWPVRHAATHPDDQFALAPEGVWAYFRGLLSRRDITIVVHNAQYDIGWLETTGIPVRCHIVDTGILAPLVDEHRHSYSLDALTVSYLGPVAGGKDDGLLARAGEWFGFDPLKELYRLPSQYVGGYAQRDARITLDLYLRLMKEVARDGLEDIVSLEHRLIPVELAMRRRGILIDHDHVLELEQRWSAAIDQIKGTYGIEDFWSADAVWAIAQHRTGVQPPVRTLVTDRPSITQYWLADNAADEFCAAVGKVRKIDKLLNTFLRGALMKYSDTATGRIHPSFHALRSDEGGTISGRYSCSHPNVQQVPIRGDRALAIEIRNCFLPEPGHRWAKGDYSQQEVRSAVHYAVKIRAPGAYEAARRWIENPTLDYYLSVVELAGISRPHAKTIHLGLTYGMGEEKLAFDLKLSLAETRTLLAKYYEMFPFIPVLQESIKRAARKRGYITTFAGRRCRFPDDNESIHAAVNRLMQGSGGDQIKMAMVRLYEDHHIVPLLSLHDESDYSVPDDETAQLVKTTMETAITMEVPSYVEMTTGKNWGDACH